MNSFWRKRNPLLKCPVQQFTEAYARIDNQHSISINVRIIPLKDEPLIAERIEQLLKAASEKRGPEQPLPPRVSKQTFTNKKNIF